MTTLRAVWLARLLLAALLAFALEIVLWPQTPERTTLDLLVAVAAYLALAAALPDLMQRARVRDVNGLLALAGMAALLAGLIVQPRITLQDAPLTILTRILGAPTAACLLALAAWWALLRGRLSLWLLAASALAGATWGLYGRWFPSVVDARAGETPLATLALAAVVGFVGVAVARLALAHSRPRPASSTESDRAVFRLTPVGWSVVALVLAGLVALRLAQGWVDGLSLVIVAALLAFTSAILWLYRRKGDVTMLERALPPGRVQPALLLAAVVFAAAGLATYRLPRSDAGTDPLGLLGALWLAFGAAWLPALSLVIGIRALSRQLRAQQL